MESKAQVFEFSDYKANFEAGELSFKYNVVFDGGRQDEFVEKLYLPRIKSRTGVVNSILQSLHLVLGISYFKLYCPPTIRIIGYSLAKDQADFWNTVYTKGLGEFFYKNKIDFRSLVKFPYSNVVASPTLLVLKNRSLLGIGGGKDSILAAQLLKDASFDFNTCYIKHPLKREVAKKFSTDSIEVGRELDPKLLQLAESGKTYAGHIPISAIYAFLLVLLGIIYDYRYLIVGNERSSNYGNVQYLGEEINHQWSKSIEFENLFRDYIKHYITDGLEYFSLLRPFYEIEIVRHFSQYPEYFKLFTSCNMNFRIKNSITSKRWCGECAKCAFVFLLMAAFLPKNQVETIFGKNLFQDTSLLPTFRQLLGIEAIKPFDCVGTAKETIIAFYLASENKSFHKDSAMEMFKNEVLPNIKDIHKLKTEVFSYGDDSNIPDEFKKLLTK